MSKTGQFQLGIDIGGTFTDFSLSDPEAHRLYVHKQPSTPDNPLQSVCEGLSVLLSKTGVQLAAVSRITHATTLVANAVLERKGDITGMLCTKGFISVLDIGREQRYDLYDMRIEYPEHLVPLPLRRDPLVLDWAEKNPLPPMPTCCWVTTERIRFRRAN